jgi:hypothetical protein
MMCGQKVRPDFDQIPKILTLTRVNISAASCNEALYPPMIVAAGWLGP